MTARFAMSDADWRKIGTPWKMPKEARSTIDELVNWFVKTEAGIARDRPTAASRDALLRAAEAADRLVSILVSLPPPAVYLVAFPALALASKVRLDPETGMELPIEPGWGWSPSNRLQSFNQNTDDVRVLAERLRIAAAQYEPRAPGRDSGNVDWLVSQCEKILFHHAGCHLGQSKRRPAPLDFVKEVCRLADRTISEGSILDAVKKVRADLKRRGEIAGK